MSKIGLISRIEIHRENSQIIKNFLTRFVYEFKAILFHETEEVVKFLITFYYAE